MVMILMSPYRVQIVRRPDGENHPVLVSQGRPLVLPNLWADELAHTRRFNTVRSYLEDLAGLYERLGSAPKERESDLDLLLRAIEKGHRVPKALLRKLLDVVGRTKGGRAAAKATQERRMNALRAFIRFVSDNSLDAFHGTDLAIQIQVEKNLDRTLRALTRLSQSNRNEAPAPRSSSTIPKDVLRVVSDVMHPESELNPFKLPHVRVRNYCILHVALQTFARRGELALLETSDLLSDPPRLRIGLPSRVNANKRKDGASLKTRGREIEIEPILWSWIAYYVTDIRDKFLRRGVPTTALFVSAKDGRRLAAGTINQILEPVQEVPIVADAIKRIHPHGLRATATNNFRRQASAASPPINSNDLIDSLTMLAGWSPDSKMVRQYTRDAIAERIRSLDLGMALPTKISRG